MTQAITQPLSTRLFQASVVVAALGYMVDLYDLFLFNMVRVKSLTELGLSGAALTDAGLMISNSQLAGLLLGAILWGTLADKIGRKPGLFASILIYSLGSFGCAFVQDAHVYAVLRFFTGIGLAGELGAGIALIAEKLPPARRGYGVMIFITAGFVGVVTAALATEIFHWRHLYAAGGVAGFALLFARFSITESALFDTAKKAQNIQRGHFGLLFANRTKAATYLAAIALMLPPVFVSQIVWTLSPEIGRAMGVTAPIKANIILAAAYVGIIFGDLIVCALSEKMRNRKKPVAFFLFMAMVCFAGFVYVAPNSYDAFFAFNVALGFLCSFWVVGAGWAAEQFGTNIRATVATTVPNFARATAIPMNLAFAQMKTQDPVLAVAVIGCVIFALSAAGWFYLKETYGRSLDFVETK